MKNLDINQIYNLYFNDKYSTTKIAELIGDVSSSTIANFLKRHGYSLNKTSQPNNNRHHNIDLEFFEKIDSKNKAYLLGLIISDGCVNKYKLTFTSKDIELVEIFKRELKSEHKLAKYDVYDKRTNKTYTRYSLQITSKKIVDDLNKLGIYSNKSFTCEMPNIPDEYFWHFIRGIFDGDGTIHQLIKNKKGRLRFGIIGAENLLMQINVYLKYNNINHVYIRNTKYKSNDGKLIILDCSNFKNLNTIKNNMYNDSESLRLTRKYDIFQTLKEYRQGTYNRLPKLHKIEVYDYSTNQYIKTFNNIHDLCNALKIRDEAIRRVIRGERNHTKGFYFRYVE